MKYAELSLVEMQKLNLLEPSFHTCTDYLNTLEGVNLQAAYDAEGELVGWFHPALAPLLTRLLSDALWELQNGRDVGSA